MKSVKWLILLGLGLNLWTGIELSRCIRLIILELKGSHSDDLVLTIVRCLVVVFVWVVLKFACAIGMDRISSISLKRKICYFGIVVILGIDIALCVAIRFWPTRVGEFFGEPMVMRCRV